jgi:protein-disulfide isomerase
MSPRRDFDICILHMRDCPNLALARERVREAVDRLEIDATVREVLIDAEPDALATGFRGSPTILIDGGDPFAEAADSDQPRCRLYVTGRGVEGAPSVEQLMAALR